MHEPGRRSALARDDAEAVQLNLVNPARPGPWFEGGARQTRFDEAVQADAYATWPIDKAGRSLRGAISRNISSHLPPIDVEHVRESLRVAHRLSEEQLDRMAGKTSLLQIRIGEHPLYGKGVHNTLELRFAPDDPAAVPMVSAAMASHGQVSL
jgi:hypothetical protein